MIEKIKNWFLSTGLISFAYLGIGIVLKMFGYAFLAGAALGIFVYINFNVIYKAIKDKF